MRLAEHGGDLSAGLHEGYVARSGVDARAQPAAAQGRAVGRRAGDRREAPRACTSPPRQAGENTPARSAHRASTDKLLPLRRTSSTRRISRDQDHRPRRIARPWRRSPWRRRPPCGGRRAVARGCLAARLGVSPEKLREAFRPARAYTQPLPPAGSSPSRARSSRSAWPRRTGSGSAPPRSEEGSGVVERVADKVAVRGGVLRIRASARRRAPRRQSLADARAKEDGRRAGGRDRRARETPSPGGRERQAHAAARRRILERLTERVAQLVRRALDALASGRSTGVAPGSPPPDRRGPAEAGRGAERCTLSVRSQVIVGGVGAAEVARRPLRVMAGGGRPRTIASAAVEVLEY